MIFVFFGGNETPIFSSNIIVIIGCQKATLNTSCTFFSPLLYLYSSPLPFKGMFWPLGLKFVPFFDAINQLPRSLIVWYAYRNTESSYGASNWQPDGFPIEFVYTLEPWMVKCQYLYSIRYSNLRACVGEQYWHDGVYKRSSGFWFYFIFVKWTGWPIELVSSLIQERWEARMANS